MCATSQYGKNCSYILAPPTTYTSSLLYFLTSLSTSSTLLRTNASFTCNSLSSDNIIFFLFSSGRFPGNVANVFLPSIITFPSVSCLKSFISLGILTRRCPSLPIAQLLSTAAIIFIFKLPPNYTFTIFILSNCLVKSIVYF